MTKKNRRGENPNSHHNKPRLGVVSGDITLTPEQWAIAEKLGNGNKSKGVRSLLQFAISSGVEETDKLFAKLPNLGKAKVALQMLLDGHSLGAEYAEAVLLDLEDLEIENLYSEVIISEGHTTKPSCFIV